MGVVLVLGEREEFGGLDIDVEVVVRVILFLVIG